MLGGPQPPLDIQYRLNDSSIVDVKPNGLIIAKKLGDASIECTVYSPDDRHLLSTTTAYVHVVGNFFMFPFEQIPQVSMTGIRIHAPTVTVYTGVQLPLYVQAVHNYPQGEERGMKLFNQRLLFYYFVCMKTVVS